MKWIIEIDVDGYDQNTTAITEETRKKDLRKIEEHIVDTLSRWSKDEFIMWREDPPKPTPPPLRDFREGEIPPVP